MSAFASVADDFIVMVLSVLGFPPTFIDDFYAFYTDIGIVIRFGGREDNIGVAKCGTKQGGLGLELYLLFVLIVCPELCLFILAPRLLLALLLMILLW